MKYVQLATLYLICLFGLTPFGVSAQPFTVSVDGNEVTDQKTGLIWRRCIEGLSWDGTACTGTASIFSQEAALQHAAAEATNTGVAWRLPNIKELYSIVSMDVITPAIETAAFPATPASWFRTSTPYVSIAGYAWSINFSNGMASLYSNATNINVRLVRSAP